ncbi:hypothetical protein PF003_g5143 [Phytophthora fragariae]|nr:hypothetical protein PF003_g5143 [Phytophthora fragariae]
MVTRLKWGVCTHTHEVVVQPTLTNSIKTSAKTTTPLLTAESSPTTRSRSVLMTHQMMMQWLGLFLEMKMIPVVSPKGQRLSAKT